MPVSDHEWELLEQACAAVPPPAAPPKESDYPDYVTNLLLTVLDLQLHNVIVNNAIQNYWKNRWEEIRTLDELEAVLARYADDPDGNVAASRYLWAYGYGGRVGWLRGLVHWARARGLVDQEALRAWAHASTYAADFAGQVKWLGISAYQWLLIRMGVDTLKPDVWLHRFVVRVIGRDLDDAELVRVLTEAAHRVGRSARELDAGIWESERGGPGSI